MSSNFGTSFIQNCEYMYNNQQEVANGFIGIGFISESSPIDWETVKAFADAVEALDAIESVDYTDFNVRLTLDKLL